MKTLPRAGDVARVVRSFALSIEHDPAAYRGGGYYDEEGERFIFRGGVWNDPGGRAGYGVTKAHVTALRAELAREVGARLAFDDVDALLSEAVCTGSLEETMRRLESAMVVEPKSADKRDKAAKAAERKRRSRKVRGSDGRCPICSVNFAEPPRKTCGECRTRIAAYNKAHRKS